MSSDEDGAELMAAFKKNAGPKATPLDKAQSHGPVEESTATHNSEPGRSRSREEPTSKTRRALCVRVRPVLDRDAYTYFEPEDEVEEILREFSRRGDMLYDVMLLSGSSKQVSVPSKGESVRAVKAEGSRERTTDSLPITTARALRRRLNHRLRKNSQI
jgi:hypothetical protein